MKIHPRSRFYENNTALRITKFDQKISLAFIKKKKIKRPEITFI